MKQPNAALLIWLCVLFAVFRLSNSRNIDRTHTNYRACEKTWVDNNKKSRQLVNKMVAIAGDAIRFKKDFQGLSIFDLFEPQWTCPYENRVGKDFGDGGKFVCGSERYFEQKSSCLIYSIGSSGDFSFEVDVLKRYGRKCELHTFDPTGDTGKWAEEGKQVGTQFHPWGLSHVDASNRNNPLLSQSNPMMPLGEIVERLGHSGRTIDVLKIDCEGCEYSAFQSIWRDVKLNKFRIGQIQIEVHKNDHESDVPKFFVDAIDAGFELFHKERNHWGCLGWTCVEFSFISQEAKRDIFAHDMCPGILKLSERWS